MKYDLKSFEDLVEEGYLRKSEKDNLVLYGYTDSTTYDKHWTEHTKIARGIIFDKTTGELVAKPFPKFFNLGEMPESTFSNLPTTLAYDITEKMDGSLGIIFNHKGKWDVATRGSFYSDQALKAQTLIKPINIDEFGYPDYIYDLRRVKENITLLVEIIYPENKIVVNYNGKTKLVLLGAYDRDTGLELDPGHVQRIGEAINMECAKSHDLTILEAIALQKTLPKDREGFVVRYSNGLRVKIKGDEYMRIHKIISCMSPISLWETMVNGRVNKEYLAEVPEEFRAEYEPMVESLETHYHKTKEEVITDANSVYGAAVLPHYVGYQSPPDWKKRIGLYLVDNPVKHKGALFPFFLDKDDQVDKYIMDRIRPTGNVLKGVSE